MFTFKVLKEVIKTRMITSIQENLHKVKEIICIYNIVTNLSSLYLFVLNFYMNHHTKFEIKLKLIILRFAYKCDEQRSKDDIF